MTETNDRLLKRAEVAALLQVSPHTIRAYEIRGTLHPVRLNRRLIRYKAVDVERLIESGAVEKMGGI